MCELKAYSKTSNTQIDKCMRKVIDWFKECELHPIASCCGHGKYPMTLVIGNPNPYEIFSDTHIPRKRNIYKRDKQGYYYIPEVINKLEKKD